MAGSGYKTFAVGEVLTAANVQGYLMDQAVMKFADSGARGSAIGTATEGMLSYLDDTDAVEVYDGSAWVGVGGTPSILQVVSTTITGTVSIAVPGFQDVTGLSASITPQSATNKVLVFCYLTCGASQANTIQTAVERGGSFIAAGTAGTVTNGDGLIWIDSVATAGGSKTSVYLDSPATTSSVTYQAQICRTGGTIYVNRDNSGSYSGVSTLVLMEVAA